MSGPQRRRAPRPSAPSGERLGPTAPERPRLEPYRRTSPRTYAVGAYAVHEALTHLPAAVELVVVDEGAAGARPEALTRLRAACAAAGVPLEHDPWSLDRLRHRRDVWCLASLAKQAQRLLPAHDHVALVGGGDAGNLGTALRALVAFGLEDVALVGSGVDDWSPHVLRASVGLRCAARCEHFPDLDAYRRAHGDHAAYLFTARAELELAQASFASPFVLVFGPEGGGLDQDALAGATPVRIRQAPGVESLNLAIAVSLAAYHATIGPGWGFPQGDASRTDILRR